MFSDWNELSGTEKSSARRDLLLCCRRDTRCFTFCSPRSAWTLGCSWGSAACSRNQAAAQRMLANPEPSLPLLWNRDRCSAHGAVECKFTFAALSIFCSTWQLSHKPRRCQDTWPRVESSWYWLYSSLQFFFSFFLHRSIQWRPYHTPRSMDAVVWL